MQFKPNLFIFIHTNQNNFFFFTMWLAGANFNRQKKIFNHCSFWPPKNTQALQIVRKITKINILNWKEPNLGWHVNYKPCFSLPYTSNEASICFRFFPCLFSTVRKMQCKGNKLLNVVKFYKQVRFSNKWTK